MKTMKRLTAILLALCLLAPALPARAAEEHPWQSYVKEEVPGWAVEAYDLLWTRGIYNYYPAEPISRNEFVRMLYALLNCTIPAKKLDAFPAQEEGYFADSSDRTLLSAAGYGIMEGSVGSDGLRYANAYDHLTREQAAKMLVSLLDFFTQKLGYTLTPTGENITYADAGKISSWALPYTQRVATYGLMKGDDRGNFDPQGELTNAAAAVMVARTLLLAEETVDANQGALRLQTQSDWTKSNAFGLFGNDNSVAQAMAGRVSGYYTIDNGDGTVSGLIIGSKDITVERFHADGTSAELKIVERELPLFGTFFDSGEHFYLAFGQENMEEDDNKEVWRIVQYDRSWNRLGAVSVKGGESYTTVPFKSAIARMAVSGDGKTVTLHAARQRYLTPDDGLRHQSNITISFDSRTMTLLSVSPQFPTNHVSHSFGQFIQYDGNQMVTVDHGDGYPRAFVLQDGSRKVELWKFLGDNGDNVTHAIGSGFEVSDSGYLFLGCSTPQEDFEAEKFTVIVSSMYYYSPKDGNVFLAYTDKSGSDVAFRWLTDSEIGIITARLVKLDDDTFVAMWSSQGMKGLQQRYADLHWQKLDGKGQLIGEEHIVEGITMPPTDPVVMDGDICWIQYSSYRRGTFLYRLEIE